MTARVRLYDAANAHARTNDPVFGNAKSRWLLKIATAAMPLMRKNKL